MTCNHAYITSAMCLNLLVRQCACTGAILNITLLPVFFHLSARAAEEVAEREKSELLVAAVAPLMGVAMNSE